MPCWRRRSSFSIVATPPTCCATRTGNPCGIVMANRAGRQAVVAKTIIDATDRAAVARLAGAKFRPYPAGVQTFRRVVIGGEPQQRSASDGASHRSAVPRRLPQPGQDLQRRVQGHRVHAATAHEGRRATPRGRRPISRPASLTYHPEQQFTSDLLFEVPPDPMLGAAVGRKGRGRASGNCRWARSSPAGVSRVYVLGGCADVPRPQAEKLLRPLALMDLGTRIGKAAAARGRRAAARRRT